MKKLKYISTVVLIIVSTLSVVLAPEIVYAYKSTARKNYEKAWSYKSNSSTELSKQQFAVLYSSGAVAVNPLLYDSYFTSDREDITADATRVLAELCQFDEKLARFLQKGADDVVTFHEKRSALTLYKDEMLALKFTYVTFINGLSIVYEEKTGVITELECYIDHSLADNIKSAVSQYYGKLLELADGSYYFDEKISESGLYIGIGIDYTNAHESESQKIMDYTN